jgi:predicted PhzF superfamily epimerase YddE/YHI9
LNQSFTYLLQDFPSAPGEAEVSKGGEEFALIAKSIGLHPDQLIFVGRNRVDVLVEVEQVFFHQIKPNFGVMKDVPNCRVLSVTCSADVDSGVDFFARSFAPSCGVDEDPVCGSAHCYMGMSLLSVFAFAPSDIPSMQKGPHWAKKLGKMELVSQARSARGGYVRMRMEGGRVALGGQAVMTMKGELLGMAARFEK